MTATLTHCAILAGGLGTRLGAITAATPKPVLDVAGRPFLAWMIAELSRFGVTDVLILAGHLSERVEMLLRAAARDLPRPVGLSFSVEERPLGTAGALRLAAPRLPRRFLLCNGDSLFDTNIARLLAAFAADGPDVAGRMLLRRIEEAGRYGTVERQGDRVTAFHERPPSPGPATINAGIYALDRDVAEQCPEAGSLERDVLPALAAAGRLRGTAAEGWFIDIGIPADLARARTELASRLARPALFLDRDGVLNHDHGHVGTRDRFEWIPDAPAAVADATDAGWHVFVVTNQSGVARGLYTEDDVDALMAWIADTLRGAGGTLDDWRHCPTHPEAPLPDYRRENDWRKPGPGMILDLIRAWRLDPACCALIGDQPTDLAAAAAAGITAHRFDGEDLRGLVRHVLTTPTEVRNGAPTPA